MQQRLKHFLLTVLVALCSITTFAHDFEVDGIYYNYNNDGTSVSVTYRGNNYRNNTDRYTGAVTIPASVTYNGQTYSVTSIGHDAFYSCSGLTSVTIPNSVTSIGNSAFSHCSGLTSVTIPNSVTSIGHGAFYQCSGLTKITVANDNMYYCDIDGVLFNKAQTELIQFPIGKTQSIYTIPESVTSIGYPAFANCGSLTSVTIPNSVTSIGDYTFSFCSGLTSVTIPNSVTSIGIGAFGSCSGLTSVTIPNSVTSIKAQTFSFCSGLTSVTIPNSVTSIGHNAFTNCRSLTSVTIPNSVTSIGWGAFGYCRDLTFISVEEDNSNYCDIDGVLFSKDKTTLIAVPGVIKQYVILGSVTSIGDNAFSGCSGLTSVTIPNSVTSLGDWAFSGCSGLTSVTIPNSVTNIGDYAFYGCHGLTSVTIGNSVKSIGNEAFKYSRGLTEIISLNTTPPSAETDAFEEVSKSDCVVKVPAETLETYKAADGWEDFENIVALEEKPTYSVASYKGNSSAVNSTKDIDQIKAMTLQNNEMVYVDAKIGAELPTNIVKKNSEGDWVAKEIELTDGVPFYNPSDVQAEVISYTRDFTTANWQALYVPFDVQYEDWADKADVAYINNVHQFDDDEDGRVERTVIEYLYKKSGTISANKPYLIRPKQTGEMTLTSRNATLKATPATGGSVDCSSTTMLYTLTGTYQTITDMYDKHWYALSDGALRQASHSGVTLAPFRFYLNTTDRDGNPVSDIDRPSYVRLMIGGLMIDEETGIETPDANTGNADGRVYDLQGRRVETPKHGLYIIGGKKMIIK